MKSAFSMIELIFTIVVIGILASAARMVIPDTALHSDTDFILQKIREVKMQALLYDHALPGDENWRTTDYNDTCITLSKDYLNKLEQDTNSARKYHLNRHTLLSATVPKICFDHEGRPYKNDYELNNFLDMPIELNITYKKRTKQVLIMPFSGGVIVKR